LEKATIKDVAKAANVSIASASRALNGVGRISPITKDKILKAARDLNYVPHFGARSLIRKKTDIFGVLLPDLYGEFFSELVRGVDTAARTSGYQILLSSYHNDANETKGAIAAMRGRVDGIIVMTPYEFGEITYSDVIGAPIVQIASLNNHGGTPIIAIDNFQGAKIATEHLLKQGYKNIAHLSGPKVNMEAEERMNGYHDAIKSAGLEPKIYNGDFREESGFENAAQIADDIKAGIVDAVFAANDMMAVGLIIGLKEKNINVPNDIGIIGFDDVPIGRYITPSLSSLGIDMSQLGKKAVEILNILVNGKPNHADAKKLVVFTPHLYERESTRKTKR
jgi:LacI family transcriptional regulator